MGEIANIRLDSAMIMNPIRTDERYNPDTEAISPTSGRSVGTKYGRMDTNSNLFKLDPNNLKATLSNETSVD